ncbi:MAG: C4-type zinc ribbon domain-containing protein [Opitutaceae bacterium]|nr:C4-type zinc ribbon domain-containing protein [Opitutaceae bacterium]
MGLDKLLVLQERDQHLLATESQLKAVPRDLAAVEQKIAAERAAIEAAKVEMKELEAKKKLLETDIQSAEEQVARYKTQQMEVRKNDEYQALTHQIETTMAGIVALEEEELKVMYAIDEAKQRFAAAEAVLKNNIAGHEERIRVLRERETVFQTEAKAAQAAVSAARTEVPESLLKLYDRLARKPGLPVCVPINDYRCGGCHLKVSANVEMEARKANEVTTCDQCSRVVYWES